MSTINEMDYLSPADYALAAEDGALFPGAAPAPAPWETFTPTVPTNVSSRSLTREQRATRNREIRQVLDMGADQYQTAEIFGMDQSAVSRVFNTGRPDDGSTDQRVPTVEHHPETTTTTSGGSTALVTADVLQARRATTPEELPDGPERTVFTHSEATRAVWHAARARMGAPLAVLGAVMAQTVAATGPHVQLPPLIGIPASLNLLVGLVGEPGGGKGTAEGIAASLFAVVDSEDREVEVPVLPLGTGQGIAELFTRRDGKDDGDDGRLVEATPDRVIFRVPEIDSLTAAARNRESTIMPTLRQAFMGEPLGHTGATRETTRNVPAHSYRVCVVMGIQPRRSGGLLQDADGGTPQRVLWLPVDDPSAPEPGAATPWTQVTSIRLPAGARATYGGESVTMTLPDSVGALVRRNRLTRLRGEAVEGLDGHLLLTQEKVAAALALMDSRMDVTEADWSAAGAVIDLSTRTREVCQRACSISDEDRQVEREERRDAALERVAVGRAGRARTIVEDALRAGKGRCSKSEAYRKARRCRDEFEDVVAEMTEAREIAAEADPVTGKVWLIDLR